MASGGGTSSQRLNKSCILVIVVAGVERFAFKGVASNLVVYLTEVMNFSNSSAAKTVNTWCGVTFMLPLFGAYLADSFLDRYSTILASSCLYIVGLVALTLTTLMRESTSTNGTSSSTSLLWSLYLISLGQGGYNPCLQAFGAEQLDNEDELPCSKDLQSSNKKGLFFQWWYFGICTGSLIGVSLMSYLQDTFGWAVGFAIPTIAMTISVAPFLCGTRFYTRKQPEGRPNKHIQLLIQAIKASVLKRISSRIGFSVKGTNVIELEMEEKPLCLDDSHGHSSLDERFSDVSVCLSLGDAKDVLKLLPIWIMLLMFAVIFQQPATFFTKQGMTMKRNIGKIFMIPPATLQSAINISIILLMPYYDKIVIPIMRLITGNDRGVNVMQRMGTGMFLSIIAMAIAAIVETIRLQISNNSGFLESNSQTVSLSIFWLLPQYILLGVSDVFTVVGMQEFFYTEVPSRMKTMGMALHLSVFGVGSFLSAILISFIEIVTSDDRGKHSWFSDDMREARLDKYYWLLALCSAISLLFFAYLCRYYNCRNTFINGSCK
ncbi:hypothetical protein GIB67_039062 [Kingdonia uniflora]|uniref:NPF family transporter n=1 Tax=Kingdonia uniflora TaxID=39325 RepID=A0A7J7LL37_9MAGN|nr:hypothetical protein GIB67_039062 [Kingdonia uniflora]